MQENKNIRYSTISIPKELHQEIEELITKNPELGYSSVAELCKEAIRLRLYELKMEERENYVSSKEIEELLILLEEKLGRR
ncbi:MAG: hypothetical protein FE044_03345 [Thermoplasmata archaeon]|nr:MAG: hypothetical protein FE044_03345 [Thermoplasmata archaeon]KAA0009220.1 MAG: hypothetical protein FE036_00955 [Thermoplasmata archaeon]MCD6573077.1 hypothetical protein [Thermoplasmata archaeon]